MSHSHYSSSSSPSQATLRRIRRQRERRSLIATAAKLTFQRWLLRVRRFWRRQTSGSIGSIAGVAGIILMLLLQVYLLTSMLVADDTGTLAGVVQRESDPWQTPVTTVTGEVPLPPPQTEPDMELALIETSTNKDPFAAEPEPFAAPEPTLEFQPIDFETPEPFSPEPVKTAPEPAEITELLPVDFNPFADPTPEPVEEPVVSLPIEKPFFDEPIIEKAVSDEPVNVPMDFESEPIQPEFAVAEPTFDPEPLPETEPVMEEPSVEFFPPVEPKSEPRPQPEPVAVEPFFEKPDVEEPVAPVEEPTFEFEPSPEPQLEPEPALEPEVPVFEPPVQEPAPIVESEPSEEPEPVIEPKVEVEPQRMEPEPDEPKPIFQEPEPPIAAKPNLKLDVRVPANARQGDIVEIHYTVTNRGDSIVENVGLNVDLPDGFQHAWGRKLMNELGALEPGESWTGRLKVLAAETGEHVHRSAVVAGDHYQQAWQTVTQVKPSQQMRPVSTSRIVSQPGFVTPCFCPQPF